MRKTGRLYHFWLHFKHVLTAWNTTGEAIHSPYLFHLVRFVLRDENSFYAFGEIERTHGRLTKDERTKGRMMFRIVNFMTQHLKRPLDILEVGEKSVLTEYLQRPDSRNRVTITREDSLYIYAREQQIDVAYIHAGFSQEQVLKMADFLLPRLTEKGALVIDGLYESDEAQQAWRVLKADKRVTTSIDCFYAGLLFVDKHYLKRHYRVRITN